MFISFKQSRYKIRAVLFCSGSADFFTAFRRDIDFITNKAMASTPVSHIPHNRSPRMDGVSLLTDSAKSFSCFTAPEIFGSGVPSVITFLLKSTALFHISGHAGAGMNPNGRKGKKGTAKSPSSRYHKLNCIRLVKQILNIRFTVRKKPVIIQIKILHRKKRIPKSAMLISPVF